MSDEPVPLDHGQLRTFYCFVPASCTAFVIATVFRVKGYSDVTTASLSFEGGEGGIQYAHAHHGYHGRRLHNFGRNRPST
jgi:hypothetical protein